MMGLARNVGNLLRLLVSARESEEVDVSSGDHLFSTPTRAILITGDGDATLRLADDDADLPALTWSASGVPLPFAVKAVRDTGYTATIIGLW